jgi:ADP-ribose pyrophosphatase YjhB (NUDIX family)
VEEGETFEQALQREGREELGVNLRIKEIFAIQPVKKDGRDEQEIFYLCEVVGGVLGTGNGPEYQTGGSKGSYEPMWAALSTLPLLRVLPESIRDKVLKEVVL